MTDLPFVDTNILLRHFTQDHPDHSPRSTAYLTRVEQGELRVRLADTVIFETVFTLERFYRQSRPIIRDSVLPLIELESVVLPNKEQWREVFALYIQSNLSFVDVYHIVLMRNLNLIQLVSFDQGFDRIPGIQRIEP